MDDLLRESEKHKRQMSHNQKVILGSMTEIGTLGENTERSPGHIITPNIPAWSVTSADLVGNVLKNMLLRNYRVSPQKVIFKEIACF